MTSADGHLPDRSERAYAVDARRRLLIVDVLSVVGGVCVALALHRPLGIGSTDSRVAEPATTLLIVIANLVLLLRLAMSGDYSLGRRFQRVEDVFAVTRSAVIAGCISVTAAVTTKGFFLDFEAYSRSYIAIGVGVPYLLVVLNRIAGYRLQRSAFLAGHSRIRQLVVGDNERVREFMIWINEHGDLGVRAIRSKVDLALSVAPFMEQFVEELSRVQPHEVVLALEDARPDLRNAMFREASFRGYSVEVLPDALENHYDLPFPSRGGIPVSEIYDSHGRRFARSLKYAIDRAGTVVGLVLLLPVLAGIALAIRLDDGGPVLFAQERVGERGKRFRLLKFRTMAVDAEERLDELREHSEVDGPIFKMQDDPRVTRVGRILRKTSMDELPQLWNVLFGEMSLVGPRPPLASEVDEYEPTHVRRLMVRPGMTGLWQVSGRSGTSFDEMVRLDLRYIDDWTFQLDAKILLRTVRVVLSRRGAY